MTSLLQSIRALRNSQTAKNLTEWHHNLMGYRKMGTHMEMVDLKLVKRTLKLMCALCWLGLRYDDLIPEENEVVQGALNRLPPKEFHDRVFRQRRAINLSAQQSELEPKEWTKPEEECWLGETGLMSIFLESLSTEWPGLNHAVLRF
ncbi:hypothetical protein SpCBS45565_g03596 [Spizellomyces sp. 'palustris']|nr:hypothetical protein SpCBS45565_g03596 [Spizellomyces sp. 'palustris']